MRAKTSEELNALETPPPNPFRVTVDVTMTNDEEQEASGTITYQTTYDYTPPPPPTYTFRLVNALHADMQPNTIYIRCGSAGDWTAVGVGNSADEECHTAETKMGEQGNVILWNYRCASDKPVFWIKYLGYYIGRGIYRSTLYSQCVAS